MQSVDPMTSLQLVKQNYPDCNLGNFVQTANRERQSNICLIDLSGPSELVLTYADLEAAVRRAAGALAAAGCGRGTRLAIALPNSSTFLIVFLAAMRLGGIPILLNFKLNPDVIRFVLTDSGAHGVLTDTAGLPGVVAAAADSTLQFRLSIGEAPVGWQSWSQLFDSATPTDAVETMKFDDQAFQPYTSGSTGVPKGFRRSPSRRCW